MSDPICAVATPNGHSAIGVIRLTGEDSHKLLFSIFKPLSNKNYLDNQSHVIYGKIEEDGRQLDDVIVLLFPGQRSFTGEEAAEIQSHGNPLIIKKIIQCLYKTGFRPANPGEFTYRAFLSGKLDLTQAEAIKDIIEARTERSLQKAMLQKDGYLKKKFNELRSKLLNITADFTAELDFADEDIQFLTQPEKIENLNEIIQYLTDLGANSKRFQMFRDGIEIVIIGAPNAGKSSLLNALSGKNRAIVSDIPGTTRDYLESNIEISGMPVIIVDTAGIRESQFDSIEKLGMDKTREKIQEADIRMIIVDASHQHDSGKLDELKNFLHSFHMHKSIIVLNKWDIVHDEWKTNAGNEGFWNKLLGDFELGEELYFEKWQSNIIPVSAKTGYGISELVLKLEGIVENLMPHNDYLVLASWQSEIMERIVNILSEVVDLVISGTGEEIIIEHFNIALMLMGEFTGEITSEDLLGRIFSRFCIGK